MEFELSLRNNEGEDLEWFNSVSIEWSVIATNEETNLEAANQFVTREYREGFKV